MFLSIATTHRPATDLGYLLMKHPDRLHEVDIGFGKVQCFYPQADETRCEAVVVLDVDPVNLVRGAGSATEGMADHYVNDRPYAASSLIAVALNRIYRTAMSGRSRERQTLADSAMPLEITITPLPVRGHRELVQQLFEPLGWQVDIRSIEGVHGPSCYIELKLSASMRLADALSQIYVLIPVLDDEKHYWIGDEEVNKLLLHGEKWLSSHPQVELITRRYLRRKSRYVRDALARLMPESDGEEDEEISPDGRTAGAGPEQALEKPIRLHDLRLDTVVNALKEAGARSVADLGCGEGKLLRRLRAERFFQDIIGLDVSHMALKRASEKLGLDRVYGEREERITLLQGALTYRDERWHGCDAAVLVEVIEHLNVDRLEALVRAVFGAGKPRTVIVTTPNVEYNVLFDGLAPGAFRHADHRFEWSREEFRRWGNAVAARFGCSVAYSGIGPEDETHGPVTQMAVFRK